MKIEFVGQTTRNDGAIVGSSGRLLNTYREPVNGEDTRFLLKPVPGQRYVSNLGVVFTRQMAWVDNKTYVAAAGKLFFVQSDGIFGELADISDSAETSIAGNTGNVTICAGGKYYLWDGSTISQPTSGAFSNFGSVDTLAHYTLLTERNGRRVQYSEVADPGTLDGLGFFTTESREDNNVRGVVIGDRYWVFKERSIEVYYPTGSSDSPFQQVSVSNTGLLGFNLVAKARDFAFFVGSDGVVYLTTGTGLQPIATQAIREVIRAETPTHCMYYESAGQKFCVIRFANRPAWVYDIATGEWHERSEGVTHDAWSAVAITESDNGVWLCASNVGDICVLEPSLNDKDGPLFRRMVSRTLRQDGKWFSVPELEFFGDFASVPIAIDEQYYIELIGGFLGFDEETDYDMGIEIQSPELRVKISRDGGHTFGYEKSRSVSQHLGYDQRVVFRALGRYRAFTVEVDVSDEFTPPLYADVRLRLAA